MWVSGALWVYPAWSVPYPYPADVVPGGYGSYAWDQARGGRPARRQGGAFCPPVLQSIQEYSTKPVQLRSTQSQLMGTPSPGPWGTGTCPFPSMASSASR